MKKIIFKKVEFGYWPISIEGFELGILEHFLTTDVNSGAFSWIDWLNDPQYSYTSANATNIIKQEQDLILLEEVFTDDGPYFSIKKQKLIELLQKWDELIKQQPNYIVITMDGDDITIEGSETAE